MDMTGQAYAAASARRRGAEASRRQPPVSASQALSLAGACVLAGAVVWSLAELVPAVHLRDAVALHHFTQLSRPGIDEVGRVLLHLLDPLLFVIWGVALSSIALARSGPRVAVAIGVVMGLSPLTSELLKPLLAHPNDTVEGIQIGAASWPSGHATAALALVLCAVLAVAPRWRPLIATVGGAYALAVGLALLILAWHTPSDVVGGYLVATFWTALAVAGLSAAELRWPSRATPGAR
jgi:membrane-associated phospholipid phosphatase